MNSDRKSVCSIHEQAYVGRCPYCVEPEAPQDGIMSDEMAEKLRAIWRTTVPSFVEMRPVPESAVALLDAEFPYGEWASLPGGARFRECIKSLGEGRITEEQAKKILALPDRDAAAPEEDG